MTRKPDHAIDCLKENGSRSVWLMQRPGQGQRTRKSWPLSPWLFCKYLLRIAQPQCQVRGGRRLHKAGIPTPGVAEGPRIHREAGRLMVILELDFVPGRTALAHLEDGQAEPADIRQVGVQVGTVVASIAAAGFFHRDLKLSNLVIEETDAGPRTWVIDPVGVRTGRNQAMSIFRMLERLDVEIRARRGIAQRAWSTVVHEALRSLNRSQRKEVIRLLREHPRP